MAQIELPEFPTLVLASGPLAGTRYLLREAVTRLGRGADNDLVISGRDTAVVSVRHAEIRREGDAWRLCDLQSTNGTFLNGKRVEDAVLIAPCSIQLGATGPELMFVFDDAPEVDLNQTLAVTNPPPAVRPLVPVVGATGVTGQDEQLLSEAIQRARIARHTGANQTMTIMREVLDTALRRTGRQSRRIILALLALLVAVSSSGWWYIQRVKTEKAAIDVKIHTLEARLNKVGDPAEADRLIDSLDQYEDQARALEQNMLYRFGVRRHEDFLTHEIRVLLVEFGAEVYSIPPEFTEEVNRFIEQFRGPDRANMARALGSARPVLDRMRQIFERNNLPPDLAYMVLVESAMDNGTESRAGAAGFWQFTPATARQYGLHISEASDERFDVAKATRAAAKYIRDLILDFGTGSSVMLALAAYNVGPAKVTQAIHRLVQDPIKQRSFWYLYRRRALPVETRDYVPKGIAAMIIGRHPERFGF